MPLGICKHFFYLSESTILILHFRISIEVIFSCQSRYCLQYIWPRGKLISYCQRVLGQLSLTSQRAIFLLQAGKSDSYRSKTKITFGRLGISTKYRLEYRAINFSFALSSNKIYTYNYFLIPIKKAIKTKQRI